MLTEMRLDGELEWRWIVDNSRRTSVTRTFDNVGEALDDSARHYRRSALRESNVYIEIWSEKEALAGILYEAASNYDVPVVSSRGIPSISQLRISYDNIQDATDAGKEVFIYQFGDHDPTGCLIPKHIERQINEWCDEDGCDRPTIERIALTKNSSTVTACRRGRPSAPAIRTRATLRAKALSSMPYLARPCATSSVNASGDISASISSTFCGKRSDPSAVLRMLAREHGDGPL